MPSAQLAPTHSTASHRENQAAPTERRSTPATTIPARVESFLRVLLNSFALAGV